MSWKEEYAKATATFIVKHGTPVETRPRYQSEFGYMADDYEDIQDHINGCSIVSFTVVEAEWPVFDGTFAEPQWSERKGSDAVITCACGLLEDQPFRYEGTISEMIAGVLAQDDD